MAGTFPVRVRKIHNEFLDQTKKRMTAPKALNAIYRDKECPPWPIEGELSIYPRESLCRIIISRQGKICGKRISDSCAGSLRQHVKTAHLPDNTEGRQRHLQKLELNTGKLGPPGREVVAEVVKEFIRRYKNPPDLDIIHFDEDSSSDDEQEEAEDLKSEVSKSELSSISEHEQEDEDEDEDSRSQGGRSESTSTEDSSPPPDRLSEEPYESAFEENLEKGKESILEVRSGQVGPQITGDDGEEVKDEGNKSDPVDQNKDNDDKAGEVESTQEDMSDFSSVTGYERASQEEEEEEDQVFEEDIESWKEERTWEINSKRGEEFVMWDYDEEEIMAPLKRQHSNESNSSKHHQVKEEKREDTPPKRQREEDENDKDKEDRKEPKDATPSKRQRIDENKGIENQDNITLPVETIIKKEESPEPSEVYYLASEGVSPDEGACLDHEGDISMSGF